MALDVTMYTDPACPWAYSASPALAVLRWRYGSELHWTLKVIGLTESGEVYEQRGYTPSRQASGWVMFRRRFGMPFATDTRERMSGTGRACRAIVATRLQAPELEWDAFRALQFGYMCSTELMDTDAGIKASLARVEGLDADAIVAALDSPEVTEAYEADRAAARTAEGGPTEAQGRSANSDGKVRFTAPSLQISDGNGRMLEVGGFQPLEAYDVCIANLDPGLERRGAPEDPVDILSAFPTGLTTAEVAAIMAERLGEIDRDGTEAALVSGGARREGLGSDALWFSAN